MANDIGSGMATQFVQIADLKFEVSRSVEQWMLVVQQARVGELDKIVTAQAEEIHKRNQAIAKLNEALTAVAAIQAKFPSDAKAGDKVHGMISDWSANRFSLEITANDALKVAGVEKLFATAAPSQDSAHGVGKIFSGYGVSGHRTKGDIDGAITKLKSTIDALSNLQQMDTLRLQSVMNKRNESFDIMSNFIKKFSEMMASLIRNLA